MAMDDLGDAASVRLRGHHFICLQFFRGEGYSAEFVENLTRVVETAAVRPARVVGGADDVCTACPGLAADGSCQDPNAGEAEVSRLDALAREMLGLRVGDALSLAQARARLADDARVLVCWREEACDGCAWESVCAASWDAERRGR